MENTRFEFVTKDGKKHPVNVAGVTNILQAAFEIASSIMDGDLEIRPADIVQITDTPG